MEVESVATATTFNIQTHSERPNEVSITDYVIERDAGTRAYQGPKNPPFGDVRYWPKTSFLAFSRSEESLIEIWELFKKTFSFWVRYGRSALYAKPTTPQSRSPLSSSHPHLCLIHSCNLPLSLLSSSDTTALKGLHSIRSRRKKTPYRSGLNSHTWGLDHHECVCADAWCICINTIGAAWYGFRQMKVMSEKLR